MNRKDIQLLAEGYRMVMKEDDANMAQIAPAPQRAPIPTGMLRAAQPSRPALSLVQRIKMKFPGLQDNHIQDIIAMIQQQANSPVQENVEDPKDDSDKTKDAFNKWWNETISDSNQWTTLERSAALDAWMAAVNWVKNPQLARVPADTGAAVWNKPPKKEISRPERHRRFQDIHGDISGHVDHD